MPDETGANGEATVADTIEKVRSERFPDIDRQLVLEILRLHAEGMPSENVYRQVDEAIVAHTATET